MSFEFSHIFSFDYDHQCIWALLFCTKIQYYRYIRILYGAPLISLDRPLLGMRSMSFPDRNTPAYQYCFRIRTRYFFYRTSDRRCLGDHLLVYYQYYHLIFFMSHIRFRLPSGMPFYPMRYISHMLIGISVVVAILGFIFPTLIEYFALQHIPLTGNTLPLVVGQIILYQFLHGNILHIFLNSYFLYQA